MDPWGAEIGQNFGDFVRDGFNVQPTIAITRAHITIPEVLDQIKAGHIATDGEVVRPNGECRVTKAAIEPVWYLPAVAARFAISESDLRRGLFEQTGGMFPELVTRSDLHVFLPPIGGQTVYFFGDVATIPDLSRELTIRIHDECNGSDVFGSDICTCRPYLVHGIEECIKTAQRGGCGIIVYNRKEGRALGEVTKFLVYNARKRQNGGDSAAMYFHRTECVAGVQDMRFQELMPDVLHWLGIQRIDRLVSMSDMKYNAITRSGIEVLKRISIPDDRIPEDARVEMDAKKAAGYFSSDGVPSEEQLNKKSGRGLEE
jgi:GTP cyclohydrolase II